MLQWFRRRKLSRREFLVATSATAGAIALAACDDDGDGDGPTATADAQPPATAPASSTAAPSGSPQVLAPTPACGDDDDEPTLAQTEGPFFTPNSPERASLLEAGIEGAALVVSGFVLATDCRPVAGALIDFWQCDNDGVYDNEGYRLRGHQFAANDGSYRLETILPGLYTGRTRHIHVKVQAPDNPVLTTQLYFPNEPDNASDGIFNDALVMDMDAARTAGTFNFVLDVS